MTAAGDLLTRRLNARASTHDLLPDRLRAVIAGVVDDILSTTATDRADRLWPADVLVYQTNPLSLAYGACGTALVLRQELGDLPASVEAWILKQPLSTDVYPPGLYVGLSGIARAFAWMGHTDRALEVLNLAYTSPLLFAEVGVDHGMAGWGLASLSMYADYGESTHLDFAVRAGERLLELSAVDNEGRFWPTQFDGKVYLGYAYGTCGIACFLVRLYQATGDARFRAAAIEGMDFTLRHAHGIDERLQWPSHIGGRIVYPYWRLGGAGVGAALLRFHDALGDERYLVAARRVASGLRMLFAAVPGQFDGMSSVGDFLLDLYHATSDQEYCWQARDIGESILCFQIPTEGGVAFPGRLLMRLSSDYAHGSAGTAAFLRSLLLPTSRSLSLDSRLYGRAPRVTSLGPVPVRINAY